jgi:tetratricopeptide (TPR) repeat protein
LQEVGLAQVCDEIGRAFNDNNLRRVDALLWPALDQFSDLPQLWFYAGNLFFQMGRSAPAAICFQRCIDLDENPKVLANLGAAYRKLNLHDAGIRVLETALERDPNYEPALINLGSMYVNEGCPEKGIPYLERAVEIGQQKGQLEKGALWNLGLLYLEAGRFREGFDIYRRGTGQERLSRSYASEKAGIREPELLQPEHIGTGKTLIVWGEQGIGDELMFGTCLEEARAEFGEVIFECHPRLEKLHSWAHPGLRLFPTRKEDYIDWPIKLGIQADYKCPIGDLASRYRPDFASFSSAAPTYRADAAETERYRAQLEGMAQGRKIVGLATHGGVLSTARQYRTLTVPDIERLVGETDCLFISLDYDDMTSLNIHLNEKFGENRFRWFPSIVQHWDYDHTAALAAACDLNVTVCQSVAHLSAGMGLNTRVLVPKRCAWRYAPVGDSTLWYWYQHPKVEVLRQDDPTSWGTALDSIIEEIQTEFIIA